MKKNRTAAPSCAAIETLESRTLLSVSLIASKAASELHPTTSGQGVFTFSRTGTKAEKADALVVDYSVVTAGTTAASDDYASLPGTVTIAAGKPSATVVINPVTDGSSAKQETLELALGASSSYTINPKHASAVLKIAVPKTLAKVEDTVSITASEPNAAEASPSTITSGQYTVTRTGPLTSAVTVGYTVDASSTAVAGTDYTALSGTITIPAKQSMETITVTPIIKTTTGSASTVTVDLAPGAYFVNSASSKATVTIANDNTSGGGGGGTPSSDWFVSGDTYRTPISIDSGNYARTDEPVSQSINFTQLLSAQGASGAISDASIQVVEVTEDGDTELNSTVPFEFDHGSGYDATSNAAGTLTIEAVGSTAADTTRYYQVYFNTATTYTAPTIATQVAVTQNVTDTAGNAAIEIQTPSATYYVETANGGIADIFDTSNNDWVSYNNTQGAAGTYHGVPNGEFHPGDAEGFTTTVASSGPLLATITATNSDNSITYQFYANFVTATVNNTVTPYPFLYEGTPGGSFNRNDTWAISDGTTGTLANDMPEPVTDTESTPGTGEIIGQSSGTGEWAYFDSASADKFIYFAHDSGQAELDSYFDLDDDMTVFGFGRDRVNGGQANYLYTTFPEVFTFGIVADTGAFSSNAATIDGQYHAVSTTTGAVQTQPAGG